MGGYFTPTPNTPISTTDHATYVRDQTVNQFASAAARSSAVTSPVEGMLSYRADDNVFEWYDGSGWRALAGVEKVTSTASGTGVSTTETKDATGDLAFTAVSGWSYMLNYDATAIAGAGNHIISVNIRDGGGSSPTNASTRLAGTCAFITVSGLGGRVPVHITRVVACPADISAGTHTIATFYVRDANGATTSNVQLEVAGDNRQLSVTAIPTAAL